ncbi:cation:proton antiporter domain-containing protein [Gemmiger sp.]|uniref:cation:proton antiporter domain-containing protein n=1 Tax=Gemmiger sp. TaxID=2049027 RepID=UPI003FA5660D
MCALMGVSSLLGCMSMSMIYINTSDDERLFKQLNYFSPPLFFVRSGLNFDLGAIFSSSDHIGSASLLAVGVVYFVTRILGKYSGAFLGCLLAGKNKEVRNNLGLALIPQAGVAIGLAAMGARTLGGAMGDALETIMSAADSG